METPENGPKVGFVGLGVMGRPMAENLARHFPVVGFDADAQRTRGLGTVEPTSLAVIAQCSVVLLSLPSAAIVESVLLGPEGLAHGLQPGSLVLDLSTGIPSVSRSIASALKTLDVTYVDAPVSGGESGARAGTLSIMVGAEEADYQRSLPYLAAMGTSIVRVGPVGSGNLAKLANNMIVGVTFAAIAEAFALGAANGVEATVLHQALRGGWAGSAILEASAPAIAARDYQPGGTINMIQKDLAYATSVASESRVSLPMTSAATQLYHQAQAAGFGGRSQPAIYELWAEPRGLP